MGQNRKKKIVNLKRVSTSVKKRIIFFGQFFPGYQSINQFINTKENYYKSKSINRPKKLCL